MSEGKENRIGLVFDISREDKFVVAYMTDTHTVEKYSSDKANYFYNQRSFDAIMAMNDDVYKHRLSIIDMRDNSSNRHSVPSWMSDIDEKSDEIVSDLDYDN